MNTIKLSSDSGIINLDTLIDTRLLIQANSGGGKSWCIRRILEQSHGKVQQIVIDLEGEFSTLREKYDYILAGEGGDTPAEPRSAGLLARRLLELNVSAIINLYELNHLDRKRFVKLFLESMVNAPKKLWHPVLVIIDEAHVFCPEKGQAESAASVIDLATRGRKRGYCAIIATQRISKLHKDAAAECNNKLIGRTGLDIDRKRASEELGFTSHEQSLSLRTLEAGEFFGFGPAISNEITKIKIGPVNTTHPKAGSRIITANPAPPTDKIRSLLSQLADLPKEAEQEARSMEELRRENIELKRKFRSVPPSEPRIDEKKIEAIKANIRQQEQFKYQKKYENLMIYTNTLKIRLQELLEKIKAIKEFDIPSPPPGEQTSEDIEFKPIKPISVPDHTVDSDIPIDESKQVRPGAKKILETLATRYPMKFTKAQLATLSKFKVTGGTYNTYLSTLRSNGFIQQEDNLYSITQSGMEYIGKDIIGKLKTSEEVIEMWMNSLKPGAKKIFEAILERYPTTIDKQELAELTSMTYTGGSFNTYLSMLRSNGLIETQGNIIKASSNLFI